MNIIFYSGTGEAIIITHEELRKKLKKSSEQAHRELFSEYCNYVYTIVFNRLRSCRSREDIEECVCDVFADVFFYYDTEKELSGDVSGFIGTIARRKSGDIFKKHISLKENMSLDDEVLQNTDSGFSTEKETEYHFQQRIILDYILKLGEPDSTIIIQKYYYGCSSEEISKMVSLTAENVRVRCGRAVKKLREMLSEADISV